MNQNLVITIMAAGKGKRMESDLPKVLHKFKGIPMLIRIINESFVVSNKIIIITGEYDSLIKNTIKEYIKEIDVNKLFFVQQQNPCGTGDAIKYSLPFYKTGENVIILNGDMPLINSDILNKFIENTRNNSIITCHIEEPYGYGRIIHENNKFVKIQEEKDCSLEEKKIKIVNCGLYKFDAELLIKYIPQLKNNNNQKEYYLTDLLEILIQNNLEIDTLLLNKEENKYVMGVNNQTELKNLEEL